MVISLYIKSRYFISLSVVKSRSYWSCIIQLQHPFILYVTVNNSIFHCFGYHKIIKLKSYKSLIAYSRPLLFGMYPDYERVTLIRVGSRRRDSIVPSDVFNEFQRNFIHGHNCNLLFKHSYANNLEWRKNKWKFIVALLHLIIETSHYMYIQWCVGFLVNLTIVAVCNNISNQH